MEGKVYETPKVDVYEVQSEAFLSESGSGSTETYKLGDTTDWV